MVEVIYFKWCLNELLFSPAHKFGKNILSHNATLRQLGDNPARSLPTHRPPIADMTIVGQASGLAPGRTRDAAVGITETTNFIAEPQDAGAKTYGSPDPRFKPASVVAAQPAAAQPVAAQPVPAAVTPPVAAQPVAAQPVAPQPVASQPAVAAQPAVAKPSSGKGGSDSDDSVSSKSSGGGKSGMSKQQRKQQKAMEKEQKKQEKEQRKKK